MKGLPTVVERPNAAFWAGLSWLRGARIFHPEGAAYRGTLTVAGKAAGHGAPLFDRPGSHPVIARLSRALGTRPPLPDFLGLALRIVDAHGPGRHQDFPMVTSADGAVLHHALLPARAGFFGQSYSTSLVYDVGGTTRVVGAVPLAAPGPVGTRGRVAELERARGRGELRFMLATATLGGRWRPVGPVELDEPMSAAESEALRFNPWNTGGGIIPSGPLMRLRRSAYGGSQSGRGAAG